MDRVAPFMGIRESRVIVGRYVLTAEDIIACRRFGDAIAVAGYGAGIPAEMDVPTRIEGGLVWMEDINSRFPTLHWITSSKYMKTFTLNDAEIFDFRSLPDASRVEAKIITTRGYLFRG